MRLAARVAAVVFTRGSKLRMLTMWGAKVHDMHIYRRCRRFMISGTLLRVGTHLDLLELFAGVVNLGHEVARLHVACAHIIPS
jgi:hypothetical protein